MRAVKGRIGKVCPVKPNWAQSFKVELSYATRVWQSKNGVEQREATHDAVRIRLGFTAAATGARLDRVRGDLARDPAGLWAVPVPWRRAKLLYGPTAGQVNITLTEAPFWAKPGSKIILGGTVEEVAFVQSRAGAVITLTEPLVAAHEQLESVWFAYEARFEESVRWVAEVPGVWTSSVGLNAYPSADSEPKRAPTDFHLGVEVWLEKPNWAESLDIEVSRKRDVVDLGGVVDVFAAESYSRTGLGVYFTAMSAAAGERILALFNRTMGRRGVFWAPSWTTDFTITGFAAVGADKFNISGTEVQALSGSDTHNRVIVFGPTGYQINKVKSMSTVGSDTEVEFMDPWTDGVSKGASVYWLLLNRFASDDLSMEWLTTEAAKVQMNWISVQTKEVDP